MCLVIDARRRGAYSKGLAPLVLGGATEERGATGVGHDQETANRTNRDCLSSPSPLENCDLQVEVGVWTGSRYGGPLDVATSTACRRASRGTAFQLAPRLFLGRKAGVGQGGDF